MKSGIISSQCIENERLAVCRARQHVSSLSFVALIVAISNIMIIFGEEIWNPLPFCSGDLMEIASQAHEEALK